MKEYSVWLSLLKHISKRRKAVLLRALGSAKRIYEASEYELMTAMPDIKSQELESLSVKDLDRAVKICEAVSRIGGSIVSFEDEDYPPLLREIPDPPTVLYVRGKLPDTGSNLAIGIVGQRKATVNGINNASHMAYELSANGVTVVSGMAAGIDGAAHKGALDGGSPTIAVLGTAIDKCYPACHRELMRSIIENGAVISEYYPGASTLPGSFLSRNRIISGISRGLLVVEAKEESGSLVTAQRACEQNRDLFAIPGPINSPDYVGVNRLIKDGAAVVTETYDILSAYGYEKTERKILKEQKKTEEAPASVPEMPGEDGEILRAIGKIAHIDEIAERVSMDTGEVMARLTMLEIMGVVEQKPGNYFELKL